MRRLVTLFVVLLVPALLAATLWFVWSKSKTKAVVFETETAKPADIVKKTVATGAIVPRQEVEIKPRVSGVLEQVFVEPGKLIRHGDPIAKIQIIPDAQNLHRAEAEVRARKIALDNAKRELDRNQALLAQGVIAEAELARWKTDHALAAENYQAAAASLQIVREGQTRGAARQSNILVASTVDGMVIDVPVKVGFSVIESNNFNPGTTIAVVANMNDMIFQGQVDESEVGKIREGMPLRIRIGAIEDQTFEGRLEYISPKGKEIDGAIQFEIKAAIVARPENAFIRAGYSANADIVLDERKQVLALREALVQFDDGKPFVEVENGRGFEKRSVTLGLSDGVLVEVLSGVNLNDKLKQPSNAGPPSMNGGRSPLGGGGRPPRRAR